MTIGGTADTETIVPEAKQGHACKHPHANLLEKKPYFFAWLV